MYTHKNFIAFAKVVAILCTTILPLQAQETINLTQSDVSALYKLSVETGPAYTIPL